MIIVVNLDPHHAQQGTLWLDLPVLGLDWHERFSAVDEVSGHTWDWGQNNFIRLEPWRAVAHIIAVGR